MTHPLIPQILELATPVADRLNLDVVAAVFQTNQAPPVLRIDVRNRARGTGLEDCERMSRELEAVLDVANVIAEAYVLEVSSPGLSTSLSCDRDFIAFRGFPVVVRTHEPYKGSTEWFGSLVRRDQQSVQINQKGRAIAIPVALVCQVQLQAGEAEP
ncbi:ribosome maturation factor RimP [Synechococcales cyanobacterium C]|uniref:Ribosome maturation factor RimP n=1 Tax=Petrachloros mirabilis ULC683 TaxID=2781853 RepID=A0A8K1ZVR3_9CYAN|nr:ribosome maturation factor RimP [Petrachloros mirabilis]NCJ04976.1 ribosome maturation factor RimP [Petrachloros mirabilis ULC683]